MEMPALTRRNYAYARLGCAVVSALILLIAFKAGSSGGFLGTLQVRIGMQGAVLSVLYKLIVFLLLNEILIRSVRTIWLKLEKKPDNTALIKSNDLRINKTRGIAGIPYYRHILEETIASSQNGVVEIVNTLLSIAFSLDASDVHISPNPEMSEITLRIHGNLYPLGEINQRIYPHFVRRIKILSGLSIFKQSVPQDGQLNFQDTSFTVRVSVFPTVNGEKVALRLASSTARIMDIENTGMPDSIILDYKALLNRNQGMIIITGPTGSGKTTTMFSSLLYIQKMRRNSVNIVTLEDPIETRLTGFQQTQVEQATGLTFSAGLRSVLRQDPDVIMLGEIRDDETATIAARAAMTGHLILTTVHANSTTGVFNRLSQMDVDPVQLSAIIHGVISQRLCRQLCQSCRKKIQLTEVHTRQMKLLGVTELPEGPFYESEGCDECLGQGFTDRVALFEMLMVTDHLRDFIAQGVPSHILSREAKKAGMPTLLDHGLQLARAGKISLLEMIRVVSD